MRYAATSFYVQAAIEAFGLRVCSVMTAPVLAQERRIAPSHKGPTVFMEYDQFELDAADDQDYYEPSWGQVYPRLATDSDAVRARLGVPRRVSYGPSEIERLDI
jgi:arylformamidase